MVHKSSLQSVLLEVFLLTIPISGAEKSPLPSTKVLCQTRWFSRTDASGDGDEELLSDLRQENPNEICSAPLAIEAQTIEGIPASATGQQYAVNHASIGFVCINAEQEKGQHCYDYRVRFTCPPSFCSGHWSSTDVKEPKGTEKVTTPASVTELEKTQMPPDQRVGMEESTPGPDSVAPQAQTPAVEQAETTSPVPDQGVKQPEPEKGTTPASTTGSEWKQTQDQQVGIDQSTPRPKPVTPAAQIPVLGQAQTTSSVPDQDVKEPHGTEKDATPAPRTESQQKQTSADLQVDIEQSTSRHEPVISPAQTPAMEQGEATSPIPDRGICKTRWFNRDKPSGVGDEELLSDLQQENPSEICSAPVAMEAQTVDGIPALQTGQEFAVNYARAGFVCINAKQGKGHRCHDYQVRFTCPPSFCSGVKEPQGTEKVTTPPPVSEPEQKQTSPDQPGVQEPQGTEQVTTAALVTEPEQKKTSPDPPGLQEPHATEKVTPPAPVTEPEQRQTLPDPPVGIDHAAPGPQILPTPVRTSGVEQVQTSSEVPGEAGVEPSTTGADTVTPPAQSPAMVQAQTTSPIPNQAVCQTRWFNRDDASGVGDEECLSDLRQENPGQICLAPMAIEVQTVGGIPAWLTGQEFAVNDASAGFVCINAEQRKGHCCHDYQVRFTCPPSFCCGLVEQTGTEKVTTPVLLVKPQLQQQVDQPMPEPGPESPSAQTPPLEQVKIMPPIPDQSMHATQACETEWFDRDNPFGTGDHELLSDLLKENPGEICTDPTAMEVQTLNGTPASETGQHFAVNDVSRGFSCFNAHQREGVFCLDYRVRFTCPKSFCTGPDRSGSEFAPPSGSKLVSTAATQRVQTSFPGQVCKTRWFNRDRPTATGDYELLYYLQKDYPRAICSNPVALEVQTLQGIPASETGQKFACNDVINGFACINAHQGKGAFCHDYKVRFTCPASFCSGGDQKEGNVKGRPLDD